MKTTGTPIIYGAIYPVELKDGSKVKQLTTNDIKGNNLFFEILESMLKTIDDKISLADIRKTTDKYLLENKYDYEASKRQLTNDLMNHLKKIKD